MRLPPESFQGFPPVSNSILDDAQSSTPQFTSKNAPTLPDLLTIREVAARVGLTVSAVRVHIKEGRYHPTRQGRKLMFNPIEVEMEISRVEQVRMIRKGDNQIGIRRETGIPLSAPVKGSDGKLKPAEPTVKPADPLPSEAYDGKKAAQAMRLFLEGKEPIQVLIEMEINCPTLNHFWKEYLKLRSGWVLEHKFLARLRSQIDWDEDKPTGEGFMKALQRYHEKTIESEIVRRINKEIGEPLLPEEQESIAQLDKELAEKAAIRKRSAEALAAKPKEE